MRGKKEWAEGVRIALKKLKKDGTSFEEIAVKLGLSYNTIYTWSAGTRSPKLPSIRQLESIYGIKIL